MADYENMTQPNISSADLLDYCSTLTTRVAGNLADAATNPVNTMQLVDRAITDLHIALVNLKIARCGIVRKLPTFTAGELKHMRETRFQD